MGHEKKLKEEGQEKNKAEEEICDAPLETASANANADDDKEIEEVVEEEIIVRSEKTFHERILVIMEKFASYQMGQEVMERTDRMLKTLEETAKWSLPTAPEVKLDRPLPWLPFLALLILMRLIRFWCSIVSFVTRFQPVKPQEMVYFFQNRRRTLRIVRINGMKTIRSREQQPALVCRHQTVRNIDEGFLRTLRGLISGAACRSSQQTDVSRPHAFLPYGRKMVISELAAEVETDVEPEIVPSPSQPSTSKDNADGKRKRTRKSKKRRDDESDLPADEMLRKYGNEGTDATDSDYDPRDDEEGPRSTVSNCSSSAEETERENVQAAIVHNENVDNVENVENMENNDNEVRENGNSANERKSASENDSDKEGEADGNGSSETVQQNSDSGESNAGTAEVAPTNHASTPITNSHTHLAVASLQGEDSKQKSTPGHETAASLKPPVVTSSSTESQKSKQNKAKAEEKCYRTITTQTCLEIDWSITIKTEITHRRTRPKLEKLNYSVQLTPATSDEDIFYSPIGSPQDFHSIFHPAPIVKGSTTEDFHFRTIPNNTPTNGAT